LESESDIRFFCRLNIGTSDIDRFTRKGHSFPLNQLIWTTT